jgi:hypothetical protein
MGVSKPVQSRERWLSLETRKISPLELKLTYKHNSNDWRRKSVWEWLDKLASEQRGEQIPHITAVRDPNNTNLLVYDGNIRTAHATYKNYDLQVDIISNQGDLCEYAKGNALRWFGMSDFSEMLGYLRIYVTYLGKTPPEEILRKVMNKHWDWENKLHDEFWGKNDD